MIYLCVLVYILLGLLFGFMNKKVSKRRRGFLRFIFFPFYFNDKKLNIFYINNISDYLYYLISVVFWPLKFFVCFFILTVFSFCFLIANIYIIIISILFWCLKIIVPNFNPNIDCFTLLKSIWNLT